MKKRLPLLFLFIFLSGCAGMLKGPPDAYVKEGMTRESYTSDVYGCAYEAKSVTLVSRSMARSVAGTGLIGQWMAIGDRASNADFRDLFDYCMRCRGYMPVWDEDLKNAKSP